MISLVRQLSLIYITITFLSPVTFLFPLELIIFAYFHVLIIFSPKLSPSCVTLLSPYSYTLGTSQDHLLEEDATPAS